VIAQRLSADLKRWLDAGLIDSVAVQRIHEFESRRTDTSVLNRAAILAWALGAILVCGGVLLLVSAHWDALSPPARFALATAMVAVFHTAAGVMGHYPALAMALHGAGTVALGAGIALCGQIFHLEEHWATGILLWAAGAWIGYWLRRDWVQFLLAALLTPAWTISEIAEWLTRTEGHVQEDLLLPFALLTGVAYFTAVRWGPADARTSVLTWLGGLTLAPGIALTLFLEWHEPRSGRQWVVLSLGLVVPTVVAWFLRLRAARANVAAALWVTGLFLAKHEVAQYGWVGAGCALLAWWGVRESRPERINLGLAGFGITVFAFYFSSVWDKLGRAAGMLGLGLLLLGGGYALERLRRRWISRSHVAEGGS
jgi:uncharacterized membrane protein